MPSAATAAQWQLVIDPAKLWLVVEIKNGEAKKASCKLCTKWQNKVRRSRNYNDALICGIEGNALKILLRKNYVCYTKVIVRSKVCYAIILT